MKLLLSSVLVLAVLPVTAVESTKAPSEITRPKSFFEMSGKDPFARTTRTKRVEKATVATTAYRLSLNGITRENGRRFASISGSPLAEGETRFLKSGDATLKIQCKQIRDTSVIIQIGNSATPVELSLGQLIKLNQDGVASQNRD